jgi:hypothetical protein
MFSPGSLVQYEGIAVRCPLSLSSLSKVRTAIRSAGARCRALAQCKRPPPEDLVQAPELRRVRLPSPLTVCVARGARED